LEEKEPMQQKMEDKETFSIETSSVDSDEAAAQPVDASSKSASLAEQKSQPATNQALAKPVQKKANDTAAFEIEETNISDRDLQNLTGVNEAELVLDEKKSEEAKAVLERKTGESTKESEPEVYESAADIKERLQKAKEQRLVEIVKDQAI
jgi:hypothetical protein